MTASDFDHSCYTCNKPKATYHCGLCEAELCKGCTEFLDDGAFAFQARRAPELKHPTYCGACFEDQVRPALEHYAEILERAKNVFVFFTTQKHKIPTLKRAKSKVSVEGCPDRDEAILSLAFAAAEQNFNALIEVEVTAKKLRNEGYQTSRYSGSGTPAQVDEQKLARDDDRD